MLTIVLIKFGDHFGGGGELKLGGEIPVCPPPVYIPGPWTLYARKVY